MITLRPYQNEAIEGVFRDFAGFQSTLLVMATGTGKTTVFVEVGNRWNTGKVLVLAHRFELIEQAAERIQLMTGETPEIEMASSRANQYSRSKWVVSSVPSITREGRLSRFDPASVGLVIVDEAHHAVAESYTRIINHFRQNSDCRILGVTATPLRADELALGQVFESVALDYGIEPASDDGWLVPVHQKVVKVEGLDFSKVRTTAGDLNGSDLDGILRDEKILHGVIAPTVELAGDLPTLVFCVTVEHAEKSAEIFNRYKPHSANWLCGATDKLERAATIKAFKDGKTQFLCNVGVLLEGFDAPNCACIAMARPTKSIALYTQVLGRSTRCLPGVIDGMEAATAAERKAAIRSSGKPNALVLDYAGNAGRHKIISAADVLGGKWGQPVRDYARQTAEEEGDGQPAYVGDALERASDELAWLEELDEQKKRRAREAAARAAITAEVDYHTHSVSLYGGGVSSHSTTAVVPKLPATEKQVKWLVWQGIRRETAEGYSKSQASAIISKIKRERGLE